MAKKVDIEPHTVNVRQAMDLTGLSKTRLYDLAKAGKVKRRMLSEHYYVFEWRSLVAYLDSLPTDPEDVT